MFVCLPPQSHVLGSLFDSPIVVPIVVPIPSGSVLLPTSSELVMPDIPRLLLLSCEGRRSIEFNCSQ